MLLSRKCKRSVLQRFAKADGLSQLFAHKLQFLCFWERQSAHMRQKSPTPCARTISTSVCKNVVCASCHSVYSYKISTQVIENGGNMLLACVPPRGCCTLPCITIESSRLNTLTRSCLSIGETASVEPANNVFDLRFCDGLQRQPTGAHTRGRKTIFQCSSAVTAKMLRES